MKYSISIFIATASIVAVLFGFRQSANNSIIKKDTTTGVFEPVAVVELFTSQGCSSCPSADKLLGKTIQRANGKKIFALSYHVDYWNRLGWADPFSSAAFSNRQNQYVSALNLNGAYTPQIVVNGNREFVGSDDAALGSALGNALQERSEVSFSQIEGTQSDNKVKLTYKLEGNYSDATINFALVSISETTDIKRGENGGVRLTNDNVVRQLITKKANSSGEVSFAATPTPAVGNAAVIVFIQQKDFKIVGAAMAKM